MIQDFDLAPCPCTLVWYICYYGNRTLCHQTAPVPPRSPPSPCSGPSTIISLSCWHWQRDCCCSGSRLPAPGARGRLTSSRRWRQKQWWYCWTDVWRRSHGSPVCAAGGAAPVWGPLGAEAPRTVCVTSVCVSPRAAALSGRSYQLLNHPSNYRGNRASIAPSIIQGRQTERQDAARDVTGERGDNKEGGSGGRRRERERSAWLCVRVPV